MNLIYSFDVYDTCLVRNFAYPTDLFLVLAERILVQYGGNNFGPEATFELAQLRMRAETRARQLSDQEEITLNAIYENLAELAWGEIPTSEMLHLEQQLEYEAVRPVLLTKDRITTLRRQGGRIIFISDMYLPASLIRQMLVDHGLADQEDSIYVSGEVGLSKRSGRLFEHILEQENLEAGQLWHCGDNHYGDVIVPRRLGVRTTFFQQSQLNRYEKQLLKGDQEQLGLSSRLAGVSRVVRLTNKGHAAWSHLPAIAANIIAPLLTCFIAWVIREAQQDGIKRLYFVSRDGQVLLKIAQQITQYIPGPECRYLYGSRQAWFLPAVFSCHRQSLDWLIIDGQSKAPRHLLKRLDIEPDEIEAALQAYHFTGERLDKQLTDQEIESFWRMLEQPEVSSLILQKAAAARQTTLEYLCQEGLCSSIPWAVVDVGWTLKTQRSLKQLLSRHKSDCQIQGYYLAISKERRPISEAGRYRTFLMEATGPHRPYLPGQSLFRNISLIEQVFTQADHGSVIKYKREAEQLLPVLRETGNSSSQKAFVLDLHTLLTIYADEIAQAGLLPDKICELKRNILTVLDQFLLYPSRKEVEAFSWMLIGDDQNEVQYQPLARKLRVGDVRYYLARLLRRANHRSFAAGYHWLEGSVVLSSLWIRCLFLPVIFIRSFKQRNGFLSIKNWWCRVISKETL